jgi:hypothetical protein
MKNVFQSIPDCIHVYFQFNQAHGRAGNVFFERDTLYSYGYHFELAKLINGALWINTRGYSNSTGRHQRYVRQSINLDKVQNVFYLDFGSNQNGRSLFEPETIARYHLQKVNYCKYATKARGFKDLERLEYHFTQLQILANGAGYVLDQSNFELNVYEALQVLEKRREAQRLINQRREATREAKREAERRYLKATEAERLGAWLRGEVNHTFTTLPKVYLRIKGETVETTKGARVPLSEALRLLAKIRAGAMVDGSNIGGFMVTRVTLDYVQIGCHVIEFETINELFK